MNRVLVLVEGQTERVVIDSFLNPHFVTQGVCLYPRIVGNPGHKGGVRPFAAIQREIGNLLKCDSSCSAVTMFFDYYALPSSWPGRVSARGKAAQTIPGIVEPAIAAAIQQEMGINFNPARFIPYVQMHEIEALFFSDPALLATALGDQRLEARFRDVVDACGSCEAIDDGVTTAPSKRFEAIFPSYRKGQGLNAHAPKILNAIGLHTVRAKCPHFNEWCTKLEQLTAQ